MEKKLKRIITDKKKMISNNRFLITIKVFGSAGPIRFVVNGDDNAAGVIKTALKHYAEGGRLPILGSDVNSFFLYPANAELGALKPWEKIGSLSYEVRNFALWQKEGKLEKTEEARSQLNHGKGSGCRVWFQKSISLIVSRFHLIND